MSLKNLFLGGAAALALSTGLFAGGAQAASLGVDFFVDENVVGAPTPPGQRGPIDSINFRYNAYVKQLNNGGPLNGDQFFESGFFTWGSYLDNDGNTVPSSLNGLEPAGYKGYGLFSGTGQATFTGGQIQATFNTFEVQLFIDPESDTTFSLTDPQFGDASANDTGGGDFLVATATLLIASDIHVFGGLASGDFEVVLEDLDLTGSPFFQFVDDVNRLNFAGLTTDIFFPGTSTTGCATPFAPFLCQFTGSGDLFFSVPEPASVTLLGLGLLGLGAVARRRRAA